MNTNAMVRAMTTKIVAELTTTNTVTLVLLDPAEVAKFKSVDVLGISAVVADILTVWSMLVAWSMIEDIFRVGEGDKGAK